MFAKKVLIFNQVASGFSQRGRQLCGMVKLISNGKQSSEVTVFVTNADIKQFGEWWVVLYVGQNVYAHNLETLNSCNFDIPETNLNELAALLVKRDNDCRLVAECSLGKTIDFKMRSDLKALLKLADQYEGQTVALNLQDETKQQPESSIDKRQTPPKNQAENVDQTQVYVDNTKQNAESASQEEVENVQPVDSIVADSVQSVADVHISDFSTATQVDRHSQAVSTAELAIDVQSLENLQPTLQSDQAQPDGEQTAYEKFVASTQNYYQEFYQIPDVDVLRNSAKARMKSIEDYSSAFERYYATGRGDNYYDSVKNEINKLFLQFPPHYPLIEKYKESYFVRVDFPFSGKYFVLGVVQREGKIKYICYGIPGEREGFFDKDFVYVEHSPDGFWMLFQDAETGQITAEQTGN